MRIEAKPRGPSTRRKFSKWASDVKNMEPAKRITMIRGGLRVELLVGAGQHYGLTQARMSKLIGVSEPTITRKIKTGGKLGPMESERLARIAIIEEEAKEVFDSEEVAKRWLLEPNLALGDSPLSLLDTGTGADEVRKVLAAIAYGGVA